MRRVVHSGFFLFTFCCLAPAVGVAAEPDVWRTVFDRPEILANTKAPVVCVLTIQHPEIIREQLANKGADLYSGKRFRDRVQALTGVRCLHLHFTEVTGQELDRPHVRAILIGGRSKLLKPDRDRQFYELIRNSEIPIIGFCGGMQLIGKAFSARVASMRKLREGEEDPNPRYRPGLFKEWGFLPVQITRRDPLFESLPDEIVVREAHAFHILQAPPELDVLAATAECPIQVIKHRHRLLYGTQFHPEAYDEHHPQGRIILQNFLRLAGIP
ncbi:MAG: gamma-glutamyl-gamma-aminobutyrate hydrolase family protein [Planctomycetes bacterium]|nr:gamma-glutamyl-gamma-aminobutyrate hydrolase family protein [Planctomycetota bacterium]